MSRLTVVFVVALLCSVALAQVASKGEWIPGRLTAGMKEDARASTFVLPLQNNNNLLKYQDKSHGGYEFATPVDVNINLDNNGRVFAVAEGRVWVLNIASKDALSLSVIFDKFYLPEGAELYVYNSEQVLGAFTSRNNKAHGWFSVAPLAGSEITLELYVPEAALKKVSIHIAKVAHGYQLSYGSSGSCNVNTICSEGDAWRAQIRGVAMMLTQFNSRYCSGSMINNALSDGRQLFLTAAHCVGSNIYSDQLLFNYQSPICERVNQRDGPTTDTVSGLEKLAEYASSDFSLFEVEEEIPDSYNVYLSGFNAVNVPATAMVGIHHPSADIKKISFANKTAVPTQWSYDPNYYHWLVQFWDLGTTEPGSSGSPLFDQDKRIVGQLHGGAAACGNNLYDSYGALWASWDKGTQQLQPFLDPRGIGSLVVDGVDLNVARSSSKKVPK